MPACSVLEVGRPTPTPDPEPSAADLRELARRVNDHRSTVGCPPLRWDDDLERVATLHSEDMRQRDFFGHHSPDGDGVVERVNQAGLRWLRTIGENLAQTYRGPEDAMRLWVESPAHRANLENCAFRVQGIGRSGDLWTQVLAGGIERR